MNACELVTFVTSIAIAISKDKSSEELSLLASIFTQLGDTLATIDARQEFCNTQNLN